MEYQGKERRRYQRVSGRFIVSYRILEDIDNIDISQTKNISLGGMLLTTNRAFNVGTNLALEIRLPFDPHPLLATAKVVASREIVKDLIYDTHLEFISVDDKHKKVIDDTVNYYLNKDKKKG